MKAILILLVLLVTLNADRVLIPFQSIHNKPTTTDGLKFNNNNFGIGIEIDVVKADDFKLHIVYISLIDSFSHPMHSITAGVHYELNKYISAGIDLGVASKKIYLIDVKEFNRQAIPVFYPNITLTYDSYSLTILHVPTIETDNFLIYGVTTFIAGYAF